MKLVETDTAGPGDHEVEEPEPRPTPPRPPHRRVAVSALLTLTVLVATVVTVYMVFPKRDNQQISRAFEFHRDPGSFDLPEPTREKLVIFALGVLGPVPWPEASVAIEGVKADTIVGLPAVMVRYRIKGQAVSLVVQRARDAAPRRYSRRSGELRAESWRVKRWTFVAVGPADNDDWPRVMEVP